MRDFDDTPPSFDDLEPEGGGSEDAWAAESSVPGQARSEPTPRPGLSDLLGAASALPPDALADLEDDAAAISGQAPVTGPA